MADEKTRAYQAAYRAAHREERLAYEAAYREQRRELLAEKQRQYAASHKEQSAAYYRAYRASHREELAERDRRYAAEHREAIVAKQAEYYARHADEKRTAANEWRQAHPDLRAEYQRNRRAKKRGANGTHTAQDVTAQLTRQHGKCYWCNTTTRKNYHVDHVIPLAAGGSNHPENIVIACPTCNLTKGAKMPYEFIPATGQPVMF
jgi:5-methylcytosine-specific restriction endonuclease McrA